MKHANVRVVGSGGIQPKATDRSEMRMDEEFPVSSFSNTIHAVDDGLGMLAGRQ